MIQLGKTNISGGVAQTIGIMKAMSVEQARAKAVKAMEEQKLEKTTLEWGEKTIKESNKLIKNIERNKAKREKERAKIMKGVTDNE